jgi:hypothetical protein
MPPDRRLPSETSRDPASRRLPTVVAGLAVAVLAGGAFTLTYDLLREFAIAGNAGDRWAPAYPIMVDALVVVTFLSLLTARDAPWWARWIRGALLLALIAGTAAIAVQDALWGFGSLPRTPHRTGVAIAPHLMLVLAIWLWYRMIRHFRPRTRPAPREEPAPEAPAPEPAPEPVSKGTPEPESPPKPTPETTPETTSPSEPVPEPASEPVLRYAPAPPIEVTPPTGPAPRALLPTDVEVARDPNAEPAPSSGPQASTTRPDIIMPITLDKDPDSETEERPDRDPEATEPNGTAKDDDGDLPIWDWDPDPPSSTYRSSPTPPED